MIRDGGGGDVGHDLAVAVTYLDAFLKSATNGHYSLEPASDNLGPGAMLGVKERSQNDAIVCRTRLRGEGPGDHPHNWQRRSSSA